MTRKFFFSAVLAVSSSTIFAQTTEVKKDVIYYNDVAVASIPHKKSTFTVISPKGDTLFTITLKRSPYYYEYDFPSLNKTVKSVDFYTPGSSKSDSGMTRYQVSQGQYAVIRSESGYIAKKIMEFGLVKDGAINPAGVDLLAQRNPNDIVDQQLAAKAAGDAAAKDQAKKEAAILSAKSPTVDGSGTIWVAGTNNAIGRIVAKDAGKGDVSLTVLNAGGQVVATGTANTSGTRFTTGSDQKQHNVEGVNYFGLSGSANKETAFLDIAKYFVKKEYLK